MFLIHVFKSGVNDNNVFNCWVRHNMSRNVLSFIFSPSIEKGMKENRKDSAFRDTLYRTKFWFNLCDLLLLLLHTPRHKNILTHKSLNAFSVKIETRNMYRHKQLMGWYIASSQQYADLYSSVHTHIKVNYA